MIDIIIPAFNAHDTIENTIKSISNQTILDKIKVYICNDASIKNYSSIINKYKDKINIKELILTKNSGPGIARQYGIDHSNSKYIIFIDSDDEFYDEDSVEKLYNTIEENDADVAVGKFIKEEGKRKKEISFYFVWLHGKIYKREFLVKNNIRFKEIYPNEDVYFNRSIQLRTPKFNYVDSCVYLYKNNPNSITRKNKRNFNFNVIFSYIDNITMVIEKGIEDNVDRSIISGFCTSFFFSIYFFYLKYYKNKNINKVLINSLKLKKYFEEYRYDDEKAEFAIYKEQFFCYYETYGYKMIIKPVVTLEEFIKLYDIV